MRKSLSKIFIVLTLISISIFILVVQNHKVGFKVGSHGWISSHVLAIVSHANVDNYFVGYSLAFKDSQGREIYDYFDRYPVFFSVFMNLALNAAPLNLAQQVYVARQIMNIIFLLILFISFLLVLKLFKNSLHALCVVLFTFSGYYFVFYKDMIWHDLPELLGFVLLLYVITIYKLENKRRYIYPAAVLAICMGRGYASYAVLAVWVLLEGIYIIKAQPRFNLFKSAAMIIRHDSFKVFIIIIAIGAILLSYNIVIESHITDVSVYKTSIVDSAVRRTGFNEQYSQRTEDLKWTNFTKLQFFRILHALIPYKILNLLKPFGIYIDYNKNLKIILEHKIFFIFLPVVMLIIVLFLFIKRQTQERKIIYLLLVLSGFFWLFPMKNLAVEHNYTAIFYIGVYLMFFSLLFNWIPKRALILVFLLGLFTFVYTNSHSAQIQNTIARSVNIYTYDFDRITPLLPEEEANVYVDGGHFYFIPGAAYALGFYLSKHYLTPLNIADYIISKNPNYNNNKLTHENKKVFLFKINN